MTPTVTTPPSAHAVAGKDNLPQRPYGLGSSRPNLAKLNVAVRDILSDAEQGAARGSAEAEGDSRGGARSMSKTDIQRLAGHLEQHGMDAAATE
jgi:hypothetical protein